MAAAATVHPLYLRCPDARRYGGKLAGLLPALAADLKEQAGRPEVPPGAPAWRVLPHGAVVSLRRREGEEMRREIRIAREEPLETDEQRAKFEREVDTFVRHFGITLLDGETPAEEFTGCFLRLPPQPEDEGKTAVRFLELRRGEIRPGKALCHRCRAAGVSVAVTWFPPAGTAQLCEPHVGVATREEIRAVQQRLQTAPSCCGGTA